MIFQLINQAEIRNETTKKVYVIRWMYVTR